MESSCGGSELFALQVLGESMVPEFADGCIIVVDPAGVIEHGCYVVARHDEEYVFRQLSIEADRYFLRPLNADHESYEISGLEEIHGVVVQQAGRRRRDHKSYV
ncbi:MAG TPA: S24 family peptidase [Gammaproteobacteria bacterium]|nr:S24 family peptidase [Gammaproteobacteria bacterium]